MEVEWYILVQFCGTASRLNAFQLSLSQSLDVAIHGVVHDRDFGGHDEYQRLRLLLQIRLEVEQKDGRIVMIKKEQEAETTPLIYITDPSFRCRHTTALRLAP